MAADEDKDKPFQVFGKPTARPGASGGRPGAAPGSGVAGPGPGRMPASEGRPDGRYAEVARELGVNSDVAAFGARIDATSNTAFTGEKALGGQPGSLASLDVELPQRGVEYLFTTPRGEVEITAQAIAHPLLERLTRAGWVLAAMLLFFAAYKLVGRVGTPLCTSRASAIVLMFAGMLSLVTCMFPIAGLVALALGIILAARWYAERRPVVA